MSKTKVGKWVGHEQYLHVSALSATELGPLIKKALAKYPGDLVMVNPHCYDPEWGLTVNIRVCPDFDTSHEPGYIKAIKVKVLGESVTLIKETNYNGNLPVLHAKHQTVLPTYEGFDVREAAARSEWMESLLPDDRRTVRSKLGYREQWEAYIAGKEEDWKNYLRKKG